MDTKLFVDLMFLALAIIHIGGAMVLFALEVLKQQTQ